jgi:hypothetical protein
MVAPNKLPTVRSEYADGRFSVKLLAAFVGLALNLLDHPRLG